MGSRLLRDTIISSGGIQITPDTTALNGGIQISYDLVAPAQFLLWHGNAPEGGDRATYTLPHDGIGEELLVKALVFQIPPA